MPIKDGEWQSEIDGVDDPSDIVQNHRNRRILEASDNVLDKRDEALEYEYLGLIDEDDKCDMIRQAVRKYALESEQVIKKHLPDEYPDELDSLQREDISDDAYIALDVWALRNLGTLPTVNEQVTGLAEYLTLDRVMTVQLEKETNQVIGGATRETITRNIHVPVSVSMNAYRALREFWSEYGMDVQVKEKMPTDEIKYEP